MDDFTLVGARPQAAPPQHAKEPWHKDLPIVSILLLALIVLGCLLCDVFLTKDPGYMDLSHCSAAPNREFLFGTDTMGRDIFSMIWSSASVRRCCRPPSPSSSAVSAAAREKSLMRF